LDVVKEGHAAWHIGVAIPGYALPLKFVLK
jgi:hypothetical protein